MDASDIRDEDFNPSNYEDPGQDSAYQEGDAGHVVSEHDVQVHQQHQDVNDDHENRLRQQVLQNLGVASVGFHYGVGADSTDAQGDLEMGELNVDQVVANDDLNLVGVTGEEVEGQQQQHLGYDLSAQHQNLAQDQHVYSEQQVPAEYVEEHSAAVLDDHHLTNNQFPNPDMRLPSIPHSSNAYHVAYAEQTHPEHLGINLDIVGALNVDTTLSSNQNNVTQEEQTVQDDDMGHLEMDPVVQESPESSRREPASGKAPRSRHYARKSPGLAGGPSDHTEYVDDLNDTSTPLPSRRRAGKMPSGDKSAIHDAENAEGSPSSVTVDPNQPLTIDEIRRRQNRSRASGKVLPRGGACDFCKRRKLRCDGVRPECGHCAKNVSVFFRFKGRHRRSELEQRLGEIGDPLHGGLHDSLAAIEQSASPSPIPALAMPMDANIPPQDDVDLGHGTDDLEQGLHIDPILKQVVQAAEAEQQHQQNEQHHHEQQNDHQDDVMRDIEMPPLPEHENVVQQYDDSRVPDYGLHALEDIPAPESSAHQDMITDENHQESLGGETEQEPVARNYSRSPARSEPPQAGTSSAPSRSAASIKTLILKLVKGVNDVIHESSTAESKLGEKVVWSLMAMFQERALSYGYTRHINRFASSLIGFGAKPHQCLLYAILAATCLLPYGPYPHEIANYPLKALGPYFLAHAEKEISISAHSGGIRDPTRLIDTIQASALVTQVKYSEGKLLEGWIIASQALKLAVAAGLNRTSLNDYDGRNSSENDYESEYDEEGRPRERTEAGGIMTPRGSNRNAAQRQRILLQLKGYNVIVPPATDIAELGERIHLFWSIWCVERIGSLGYRSSLHHSEITTPWPEAIEQYSTLVDHPQALQLREDSVHELLKLSVEHEGSENTVLMFELKLIFLLGLISDLMSDMTCLNFRDPIVRQQRIESLEREASKISEALERLKGLIPSDIAVPPVVGGPGSGGSKIRKGFPRDKIWIHALMNTIQMEVELLKAVTNSADVEELADDVAMGHAEFVARLGKTTNPHEHDKIEPAFVVVWQLVGRYLAGRNQVFWNQGRINDAKRVDATSALVIDTMKSFGKYHHLAAVNLERLE
ncbi:hypothetical protein QFC22_005764 [Naganishia vaughanmartiniae]|uniref:Uncharacterized protein n=1 Tax=Naganishia vaughanmartiniae TaxID=1424756 RepID=A0ACC2WTE0_9TREE|nr:hypothetical protein QFC22_005764 [Naganishia vaughanmartiniae]